VPLAVDDEVRDDLDELPDETVVDPEVDFGLLVLFVDNAAIKPSLRCFLDLLFILAKSRDSITS
jgi:hypothetical protein